MAEMKITLAKLISSFKVDEVPNVTKLEGNKGDMFFFSYPEVQVKLTKRE